MYFLATAAGSSELVLEKVFTICLPAKVENLIDIIMTNNITTLKIICHFITQVYTYDEVDPVHYFNRIYFLHHSIKVFD